MEPFAVSLRKSAGISGITLTAKQLDKMTAFYTLLEEANRSFNLTSVEGPEETAIRHFGDSLALPAQNLLYNGDRVVDVGTGAGFPGIPIAILRENIHFTLLDSMKKRTTFLESAISKLSLGNVTVVTTRAEEFARGAGRERFDAALSRAVAPLNVLLEYMLPLLKPGGRALAWKGPSALDEIASARHACRLLGGGEITLHGYTLPDRKEFFIVEAGKLRQTPKNYPRKTGKPSNDPLI